MPHYTKRKDGRYSTKVYIGLDEYGRKKYKYLYDRDPKKLREKEAETRQKVNKGFDVLSLRDSFQSWRDRLIVKQEMNL